MNSRFLKDLAERVIATAAGAALSVMVMTGFDFGDLADWRFAGQVAAGAAVLSLLKGLAATRMGDPESASLVKLDPPTS